MFYQIYHNIMVSLGFCALMMKRDEMQILPNKKVDHHLGGRYGVAESCLVFNPSFMNIL